MFSCQDPRNGFIPNARFAKYLIVGYNQSTYLPLTNKLNGFAKFPTQNKVWKIMMTLLLFLIPTWFSKIICRRAVRFLYLLVAGALVPQVDTWGNTVINIFYAWYQAVTLQNKPLKNYRTLRVPLSILNSAKLHSKYQDKLLPSSDRRYSIALGWKTK